jgi:hypothetical protein
MRYPMLFLVSLALVLNSGCRMFDPDSKFNVNRGELHDENDEIGRIGRGGGSTSTLTGYLAICADSTVSRVGAKRRIFSIEDSLPVIRVRPQR